MDQCANLIAPWFEQATIVESHHPQKKDAPSGTAFMLGSAAAKGKNIKLDKIKKISRVNTKGKQPKIRLFFLLLEKVKLLETTK